MQAALFYGPEDLRIEDVNLPELAEGEVLVEIKASLTGGTDTKTYLRSHPKIIKEIPSRFGYELSGIVKDSENERFNIGDRVVAANTAPCMECIFCKKKQFELCQNLEFLMGSFSEQIIIPAKIANRNLYTFSPELDMQTAAFTQTLAVALHGFEKTQVQDGDVLCIYGIGAIGQCFIKLAKQLKKDLTIVAIGSSEEKKKLASENGADIVLDYKEDDLEEEIKKFNDGFGVDKLIEVVGKPDAWQECFKLIRPGGLINFFGGCPKGSKVELDTYQAHYDEVTITGTFHHTPYYIEKALRLLEAGEIKIDDLISHEMLLSDLEKALKMMIDGKAMKIAILP